MSKTAGRRTAAHGVARAHATRVYPWLKATMLALMIAAATLVAWRLGFFTLRDPRRLAEAIRKAPDIPGIGPLFVATYALVATFGLPAFPLTLAGGAMLGFGLGSVLSWVGALLGATGAYALGRLLGRDALHGLIGRWGGRPDVLDERSGFLTILRLRLVAVVPFNLINIGAGLAGVPFRSYVAATALGIIPGTVIYTYFADSIVAGAEGAGRSAFVRLVIATALLLALSFVPSLTRRLAVRLRASPMR